MEAAKRGSCITITVGDPVYPEDCGSPVNSTQIKGRCRS